MKVTACSGLLLMLLLAALPAVAKDIHATVVYDDKATEINPAQNPDGTDALWITTADLKSATRFEVKPQGVCRDELCFPLPKSRRQEFIRKEEITRIDVDHSHSRTGPGGYVMWFNLTAFAQLVHQPVAHDAALNVWYFGLRADQRQGLSSL